jgi:hypothetical protein
MTTAAQTRKNWLTSARTWLRYADQAVSKANKRKAETKSWEALFHAVSGL